PLSLPSLLYSAAPHPDPHSFPTRRSSDLPSAASPAPTLVHSSFEIGDVSIVLRSASSLALRRLASFCTTGSSNSAASTLSMPLVDRKSTRLNSSHSQISYAVFCLKKKTKN